MDRRKDFKIVLIAAFFLLLSWAAGRFWKVVRWTLRELWELGDDEEDEARRRRRAKGSKRQ